MRKKKKFKFKQIFILIIFSCFIACKKNADKKENEIVFTKFPEERKISFTNFFEFKNGIAHKLYVIDANLIIFNSNGKDDSFFYNYSLKDHTLSKGFLKAGRGPGETLAPFATGITQKVLWVYDVSLKKVIVYDKENVLKQDKKIFKEYSIDNSHYQIDLKDNLTFQAVGNLTSKTKIQEIDLKSTKVINEYGEFLNIPDGIPFEAYKSAHDCFILTRPDGNKTVLFYRFTDQIEIFDTKKHVSLMVKGPERFEADFDVMNHNGQNISINNSKTRFAFVIGSVTNKYIYLLYSGNLSKSEHFDYGNSVYIYDWDGNPVKKLVLNKDINTFTVSEDDKIMYASDPNSGFIIQTKI